MPVHHWRFKPTFILRCAELLKLSHRHFVAKHDGNEIAQIGLRYAFGSDVQVALVDTYNAGNRLCPFKERTFIEL